MTSELAKAAILSIPSVAIFLFCYPYRKKALSAWGLRSSAIREVCLVAYVMLIAGILSLKLCPSYHWERTSGVWGDLVLHIDRPNHDLLVNLIPLGSIQDYKEWIQWGTGNLESIFFNVMCNFIAFIPVGFLTSALFRRASLHRTLLVCAAISIFAEIGQYFIMRYASIDNVIVNLLGGACGFILYTIIKIFFRGLQILTPVMLPAFNQEKCE